MAKIKKNGNGGLYILLLLLSLFLTDPRQINQLSQNVPDKSSPHFHQTGNMIVEFTCNEYSMLARYVVVPGRQSVWRRHHFTKTVVVGVLKDITCASDEVKVTCLSSPVC